MEVEIIIPEILTEAITALSSETTWYDSYVAVAVVSGLAAIIGAIATNVFNQLTEKRRVKTQKELKQLEHENRKVENMHEKQVAALKELCLIKEKLLPNIWPNPYYYDDEQALSKVVDDMSNLLKKLDKYLKDWSYLLPESMNKQLRDIIIHCNDCYYHPASDFREENNASKQEIEAAGKIISELDNVIAEFKELVGLKSIRGKVGTG